MGMIIGYDPIWSKPIAHIEESIYKYTKILVTFTNLFHFRWKLHVATASNTENKHRTHDGKTPTTHKVLT